MLTLQKKHREVLRDMVGYTCQWCHKHEREVGTLHVHRIRRGKYGGEYVPNNILLLCVKCHNNDHHKEFR